MSSTRTRRSSSRPTVASKRRAPRKALPANWNLEQLDEELRVALGQAKRPGLSRFGDAPPQIVTPQRERVIGRGARRTVVVEDAPWTAAQLAIIQTTLEQHVADPLWHEKQDNRQIRLILTDADFDAVIALDPATLNVQQKVTRKLALAVRALARMERGETL